MDRKNLTDRLTLEEEKDLQRLLSHIEEENSDVVDETLFLMGISKAVSKSSTIPGGVAAGTPQLLPRRRRLGGRLVKIGSAAVVAAALMLTFFSAAYAGERNQGDGIDFDSNSAEYAPDSKSGGKSAVSSIVQLNSYPVFDKYKRHKNCVLTVINNPTMNYRELKVNGNPKIVAEIRALVEKDISLSDNVIRNYNESSDDIVAIYVFGTLGYTEYINTDSCKIFIGGS